MSTFGQNTVISDSALARLSEPGWLPVILVALAVILAGALLIGLVRECRET